jgi:hypothetical protein
MSQNVTEGEAIHSDRAAEAARSEGRQTAEKDVQVEDAGASHAAHTTVWQKGGGAVGDVQLLTPTFGKSGATDQVDVTVLSCTRTLPSGRI